MRPNEVVFDLPDPVHYVHAFHNPAENGIPETHGRFVTVVEESLSTTLIKN